MSRPDAAETEPAHGAPPPQDIGAERAVIGACMNSPETLIETRAILNKDDFYAPAHMTIWDALCALADAGKPTGPVMLTDELRRTGDLARVLRATSNSYLSDLAAAAPLTGGGTWYARIVAERAGRRRLIELGTRMVQYGSNGVELKDAYEDALVSLTTARELTGLDLSAGGRRLKVRAASEIKMVRPRWLKAGTIPLAAITLLAGREGIGKSSIAYGYVARITRGEMEGDLAGSPRSVVVYATEDSWESVILPRLVATGADLERVLHVEARTPEGHETPLSVPDDLAALAEVCETHSVALLLCDPLMSLVSGRLDSHKESEIRKALDPLNSFAQAADIAVLGLIHANKSGATDPLNTIMGSRAFTAVARSVLYAVADPECETDDRYLLGHPKCNLGAKQPSERYHIVTAVVTSDDGEAVPTSRIVWDGEDERSMRDVLETARGVDGGPAVKKAADWLSRHLLAAAGPLPRSEVVDAGEAAGHSASSLKRAARSIEVKATRSGRPPVSTWSLEGPDGDK